jgi:hypothetical protein
LRRRQLKGVQVTGGSGLMEACLRRQQLMEVCATGASGLVERLASVAIS